MFRFVAIACLLAVASADKIAFTDCAGNKAIEEVNIGGCTEQPCVFKPNSNVKVTGSIASPVTAEKPSLTVSVKVDEFWVPYPGLSSDACTYLTDGCPIKKGVSSPYDISVTTFDWLPPMTTEIKFELFDKSGGELIACALATVKIEK